MADSAKAKRPYNSTRRQAQARATRRQIIDAAYRLFTESGYDGATVEAIAARAGVATETVYATFGNKRTILARTIDIAVGGDDQPVDVLQRPDPQLVLQMTDPAQLLRAFATGITDTLERVAPLFAVMRAAAQTEAEIAELLNGLLAERFQNLGFFVKQLAAHSALAAGMDQTAATETVWALTSPELFSLFTVDRGWSKARYADWLGAALVRLLLP